MLAPQHGQKTLRLGLQPNDQPFLLRNTDVRNSGHLQQAALPEAGEDMKNGIFF
jgi:hypothetical protein